MNEPILDKHLHYVLEQNAKLNLTAIRDFVSARLLHLEDSLSALPEVNEAPGGALCDIGSGAGFPGIPLAVMARRKTVLVEASRKKAAVLQKFLEQEDLAKQITVINQRVEEFSKVLSKADSFSVVTARALSNLSSLLELASPLLSMGGVFVAYKGKHCLSEVNDAKNILDILGFKFKSKREFFLSDNVTSRVVLSYEKVREARIKLPRRNGQAQKHPLK
ncbi:MAG: 16S rRNA (guanine(527)-N(7))-methyltransferase RsmG [Coriobacteriales bacterium]|jgi:16S rRNA (guanine527-N7)-methyltransferase|nr:16S rRNA (guanine(527)-N(7))-methyltransferase RsmG [Coriobacteriales bacterium]